MGDNDYFSRFLYRPSKREFEPDRVPVYCTCEMPYNPDKSMVMCDHCQEWYHPDCLQLTLQQVQQMATFICPTCKPKLAANKRQRTDG